MQSDMTWQLLSEAIVLPENSLVVATEGLNAPRVVPSLHRFLGNVAQELAQDCCTLSLPVSLTMC